MVRKTYTSSAVKNRWNKKHYDQIMFRCKIGGKELMQQLAAESGMTFAEYMRTLVIQDAQKRGKNDVVEFFGGGVISDTTLDFWRSVGLLRPSETISPLIAVERK